MRNIFLTTVALLALLAMGASAGDYHRYNTLICADCHIMHASQTHGYGSNGSGTWTPYTTTPNPKLLRQADVNNLCLQCHDGQTSAPDVLTDIGNGAGPRGAGGLNEVGMTGTWAEANGHTLGSTAVAPGSNPTKSFALGLECINCHGAHGSTGWRNLGPYGTTMYKPTYSADGTCDYSKDVWERASRNYGMNNCDFPVNTTAPTESGYAKMCMYCHTDFHGTSASANMNNGTDWLRHPTADVSMAVNFVPVPPATTPNYFTTELYRVKVMLPTGQDWGTQGTPLNGDRTITPSCFTCHKGHGSTNPFGLIFMTGAYAPGEDGDGTMMKNTCNQCHGMGRPVSY